MASPSAKAKDSFSRTVIAPVSLLVAAMIVAVIATAIWAAHRQTADSLDHERSLAWSAIAERLSVLEKTTDDYAYWDDTYSHAGEPVDAVWLDANVVRPIADKYGFRLVSVVDDRGHAVFGARDEMRFSGPLDAILSGGFGALIRRLTTDASQDSTTGVLHFGDMPALVAISRIRPFTTSAQATQPQRFLVFVDVLDETQLAAVSKAYLLPHLRVDDLDHASDDAAITVASVDGAHRSALVWRGSNPGGEMLRSILPILVTLLIAFACLTAYVLGQGRAAAARLRDSERRATQDPLTGLPNRLALFARAEELLGEARGQGFALAYLDLDGFKQVNDQFGHDMGDEVLKQTTRRMAAAIRKDDMLARLGGDEFAMLLPDLVDPSAVRRLAEQVIASVSQPIVANGATARIGVTIGVAVAPSDARDTLDLVKAADAALYRAKRQHKGTVQFALSA